MSLLERKLWRNLDVFGSNMDEDVAHHFSFLKPASYDDVPLLAAANFLEEFSNELDRLVVLGDLATTGMDQDLEVAAQVFLDGRTKQHLNAALEPRLGGLGIPMHIVPGNHDRYQDDKATPGGDAFDRYFGSVYKPSKGVCSDTVRNDDLAIGVISADFCFSAGRELAYLRRLGRGAVDDIVLAELDYQTRQWQRDNPDMPVVWALHFSPADGVSTSLVLEEREKVTNLAKKLRVNHIFCGHTHLRKRQVGTHPHIYCAGSVSAIDSSDKHFLHICTLSQSDTKQLQLEVFDLKYDEHLQEFVSYPVSIAA